MIDIHCHILPGLDDGPKTMEQALAMARLAERSGTRRIIATPHFLNGVYTIDTHQIKQCAEQFSRALDREKINIEMFTGAEIRVAHNICTLFEKGALPSLAGSAYYLFELPDIFFKEGVFRMLHQLQKREVVPVIAHPERNYTLLKKPGMIQAFLDRQCVFQLTGESVLGNNGKASFRLSKEMICSGSAHFIASDGHNTDSRPPVLKNVFKAVKKISNETTAGKLMIENPETLLATSSGSYRIITEVA